MTNLFEKYPEFITLDPRKDRVIGYAITGEFMQKRYECFFKKIDLKDKTILDLGSCTGAVGAWALENGAKFYHGVEFHKDLVDRSADILEKYFDKSTWQVDQISVEDFFKTNKTKYDIVVASGLFHAFFDPLPILKFVAEASLDIVIAEGPHPYTYAVNNTTSFPEKFIKEMIKHPMWAKFVESEPFIQFRHQEMLWGVDKQHILYNGSNPSMGLVKKYLTMLGFECDDSVYDLLKAELPYNYRPQNRWGLNFKRVAPGAQESEGYLSAINFDFPDIELQNWEVKK